jgi:hypothetical protein
MWVSAADPRPKQNAKYLKFNKKLCMDLNKWWEI